MVQQNQEICYVGKNKAAFESIKKIIDNFKKNEFIFLFCEEKKEIDVLLKNKKNAIFIFEYDFIRHDEKELAIFFEGKKDVDAPCFLYSETESKDIKAFCNNNRFWDLILGDKPKEEAFKSLLIYIRTKKAFEEEKRKFLAFSEIASIGFFQIDLTGKYLFTNEKYRDITEIENENEHFFDHIYPEDVSLLRSKLNIIDVNDSSKRRAEFRFNTPHGQLKWFCAEFLPFIDKGRSVFLGALQDISAIKKAEIRLIYEATHDQLTDLPNRTLFLDRVDVAIKRMKRDNLHYAVMIIDLDHFKWINDSMGHHNGDVLLKIVSKKIKACLREIDTVARLGGDEFGVLLEGLSPTQQIQQATLVAIRILGALSEKTNVNQEELFSSASIGIVLGGTRYEEANNVIRDADTAMYRAKENGKSCYQFFDTGMHKEAYDTLTMVSELKKSVATMQDFVLFYQPIVRLDTRKLVGYEALIRWRHPKKGILPPSQFLQKVEELGLCEKIGSWVLQQAFSDFKQFSTQKTNDLYISINLSSPQIIDSRLPQEISYLLEEHEISAQQIQLEITENSLMKNPKMAEAVVFKLHDLGLRIAIDDFGSGYSSLSYLQRFPIDNIKIDKTFVQGLQNNRQNSEIVRMVVSLGKTMNASVTAEGIETLEELNELLEIECPYGQGYLFGKPHADISHFNHLLIDYPQVIKGIAV